MDSGARSAPRIEILDREVAEMYRRMTPVERIRRGFEATEFVRDRVRAHLRGTRAGWSADDIEAELARRIRAADR